MALFQDLNNIVLVLNTESKTLYLRGAPFICSKLHGVVWGKQIRLPSSRGHELELGLPGESERTLIAIKPDGVQRRLVGQIIQRFEQRGFKLVGMKMMKVSEDLLSQHYCELRTKPFYPSLLHYMTSGPVVVMVWEGHEVVQTSRKMVGHTNPAEAQAGTVRGDFSIHVSRNVVHASDSLEGAQREIQLWFQGKELLNWDCCDQTSTCEV
ncbi:nucleoside diphosphate kinase, mitochondrial isoform X4 [Micropterus dolomieu]|uniref:nucleoside diphosphate kinase, mitochondrial isoform X4 n=1 Tax=Micropterus dolomieu TaxID=147949 RepID=UPI001E8CE6D5|nr:nucleoside diphosphate kinase, mitochondrial isoform X4 [Micropterus dolomieu]